MLRAEVLTTATAQWHEPEFPSATVAAIRLFITGTYTRSSDCTARIHRGIAHTCSSVQAATTSIRSSR